jgi:hypothetical protein
LLSALLLGACTGNTNPGATRIAAQSAVLQANANCASGETCGGYFRWRVHGTSTWSNGALIGPANGPASRTIGYTARLSPATTYDYQYCGRSWSWSSFVCVGPTAAQPPSNPYAAGDPNRWSTFTTLRQDTTATAKQFSDSIGINDHLTYWNEPLYDNQAQAVANMKLLGVTHVRVGIYDSTNSGWQSYFLSKVKTLQQAGLRLDAIVPQNCTDRYPSWDLRNPADCISALQRGAGLTGVEAFEDPNEADNSGDPNWATELRAYGQALYTAVKQLGNYPVYGPSLVYDGSFQTLGNQAGMLDFENFHDYAAATSPNPDAVTYQFTRQVPLAGLKPAVATESGYHNAIGCNDSCQPGIDQAGAAVYTLRTYLEHVGDGLGRTYTYELYDEPNLGCSAAPCEQAHFGLIDGNGTWKPAAHALANLTQMVGSGAPATVTPLNWGVAAEDNTSDLRDLDIAKPDGSHDLVLWRTCTGSNKLTCPSSVWDRQAQRDLTVTPVKIHVVGSFRAWEFGDPITGSGFWPGSGPIVVGVGADPIVLHITP